MDKRMVEDLVKARHNVKQKYQSLKSEIARSDVELQRRYKPITQPLREFITGVKTELLTPKEEPIKEEVPSFFPPSTPVSRSLRIPQVMQTPHSAPRLHAVSTERSSIEPVDGEASGTPTLEQLQAELATAGTSREFQAYIDATFSGRAKRYMEKMFTDTKNEFDHLYGVRFLPEKQEYFIGDSEFGFDDENMLITKPNGQTFTYEGTRGLYELVFKKKPLGYLQADLKSYKDLLLRTNAVRRNYLHDAPLLGTGTKYSTIIKPLLTTPGEKVRSFSTSTPVTRSKTGALAKKRGAGPMRVLSYNNKKVEFVPWKDPNKLIGRLRLLLSSKSAGHTGHTNEIIYIIDELRAAKIIA